jgi:hypothetical protein
MLPTTDTSDVSDSLLTGSSGVTSECDGPE